MRHKIREADIRRKTWTNAISDFLRRVMPDGELPASSTEPEPPKHLIVPKVVAKMPPHTPPFLRHLNEDTMKMTSRKGSEGGRRKRRYSPKVFSPHKIQYP